MIITLLVMDTPKGDFFITFCFHYINFTNDSRCPQQITWNPFFNTWFTKLSFVDKNNFMICNKHFSTQQLNKYTHYHW